VQAPPLWKGVSADKALSHDNPIQQLVRRTIEEEIVDTSTRVKCVDVWCNFLEMCEDHWRTESDVLLGVSGMSPLLAPVFFLEGASVKTHGTLVSSVLTCTLTYSDRAV
jgi:hypothetical protein